MNSLTKRVAAIEKAMYTREEEKAAAMPCVLPPPMLLGGEVLARAVRGEDVSEDVPPYLVQPLITFGRVMRGEFEGDE